ncbi:MAG TPA: cyclase family protein [Anaerolineales bacterium]
MRIYDISLPLSPTLPVWPGDPPLDLHRIESMDEGAHANVSMLSSGVHIGTHVDAPHHFLNDGRTVEQLPLEVLTGPCFVAQLPDDMDEINAEALAGIPLAEGVTRILFGTRNSHLWKKGESTFQEDFVAITEDGARWLVEKGIRLVGVDYLSVAPFGDSVPTHKALLEAGVVIVEGLDLSAVPRGFYDLYCLPLKLVGSDGAPARAILVSK